ncbi:hypothetical protein PV04_06431 [Phialophora macrospora]|uniref:Uncharacterized protein n=1 Tax=Phialophora macrospora TaxID=1851006 RepID=A0A0D2G566_9EURO|nr:hypothetical protein PV04_06431 [Phialophora macrospora]
MMIQDAVAGSPQSCLWPIIPQIRYFKAVSVSPASPATRTWNTSTVLQVTTGNQGNLRSRVSVRFNQFQHPDTAGTLTLRTRMAPLGLVVESLGEQVNTIFCASTYGVRKAVRTTGYYSPTCRCAIASGQDELVLLGTSETMAEQLPLIGQ